MLLLLKARDGGRQIAQNGNCETMDSILLNTPIISHFHSHHSRRRRHSRGSQTTARRGLFVFFIFLFLFFRLQLRGLVPRKMLENDRNMRKLSTCCSRFNPIPFEFRCSYIIFAMFCLQLDVALGFVVI